MVTNQSSPQKYKPKNEIMKHGVSSKGIIKHWKESTRTSKVLCQAAKGKYGIVTEGNKSEHKFDAFGLLGTKRVYRLKQMLVEQNIRMVKNMTIIE